METQCQYLIITQRNEFLKLLHKVEELFDVILGNVKHQFMALKRVAKLNGYHSPTVGRKYKSRYLLESRH